MQSAPTPSPVSEVAKKDIYRKLHAKQIIERVPLSVRFPKLKPIILLTRQALTSSKHFLNRQIARERTEERLPYKIHAHSSLLIRKLGSSDPRLQENKVINLRAAIKPIDGLLIQPGEIFSLWTLIGKPTTRKGYVNGMLLSQGQVIEGLGGGLCQLANLLHWMFLHAPLKIIERYHHSLDVFPDSGRTIPFGSGATILYNLVDLKAQNTSSAPIQIKLWLTDDKIHGELRTTDPILDGFRVAETDHCFVHAKGQWYRYNRLWKTSRLKNQKLVSELAVVNFAPVLYPVTEADLKEKVYSVLSFPS